ncbi:uncharacterized protein LOC111012032 isoform X2 [Momordica charantia]|uniref:Uncharacterized protein LOC111012032 isoform X2 n=1 Tax=Momordica charantia TaxID=3673 RepID=A0A6J1CK58_MOMCH|nr:uncharacterized protein LOC111012032 isoform X2 [Momordica charantia]
MELKVSQRNRADRFSLLPKLLPQPTLPSQTHRTWAYAKRSSKNQFGAVALRWRFQLQDIPRDQSFTKHHFVRIVEGCQLGRGETFTSILKQNGVSTHSIVIVNRKIGDTDLEHKGQDSKIRNPLAIRDVYQLQEKLQSSLNGLQNYKKLFLHVSPRLPPARTTSFIVLVPLIVFCARCIIGASYARVSKTSKLKTIDKSEGEHHKFRSGHWRSALRDIRELDGLDSESSTDPSSPSVDEQISVEDLSHAYKKLDKDYEKFLSECGLSNCGYWRGVPRVNKKGIH